MTHDLNEQQCRKRKSLLSLQIYSICKVL